MTKYKPAHFTSVQRRNRANVFRSQVTEKPETAFSTYMLIWIQVLEATHAYNCLPFIHDGLSCWHSVPK